MASEQSTQPPEERWGISSHELERRYELTDTTPTQPAAERSNERICSECGCRITITPAGREVGHTHGFDAPMCANHPDNEDEQQTDATALTDF